MCQKIQRSTDLSPKIIDKQFQCDISHSEPKLDRLENKTQKFLTCKHVQNFKSAIVEIPINDRLIPASGQKNTWWAQSGL